jgi:hypothetical protein
MLKGPLPFGCVIGPIVPRDMALHPALLEE